MPKIYKLLKNSTHSNSALKCLCNEADQIKNYSSLHLKIVIPTNNSLTLQNYLRQNIFLPNHVHTSVRNFSLTHISFEKEPLKPSSKVEVTVQEIKKQKRTLLRIRVG